MTKHQNYFGTPLSVGSKYFSMPSKHRVSQFSAPIIVSDLLSCIILFLNPSFSFLPIFLFITFSLSRHILSDPVLSLDLFLSSYPPLSCNFLTYLPSPLFYSMFTRLTSLLFNISVHSFFFSTFLPSFFSDSFVSIYFLPLHSSFLYLLSFDFFFSRSFDSVMDFFFSFFHFIYERQKELAIYERKERKQRNKRGIGLHYA